MTREEILATAFKALSSFSRRERKPLRDMGITDEALLQLAFREIGTYPSSIVADPPDEVLSRANMIDTSDGEYYVSLPFYTLQEGLSDLELRLWIRDSDRKITHFDVLVA